MIINIKKNGISALICSFMFGAIAITIYGNMIDEKD